MNPTANELLLETLIRIDGAYAPSTMRAYKTSFERFIQFCDEADINPLPAEPQNVARYIFKLTTGELKSSSIRIIIAAISSIHKLNLLNDPTQHPAVKLKCVACTELWDDIASKHSGLLRQS